MLITVIVTTYNSHKKLKKVIESGRAVRKKANIKVRQPLQSLRVLLNNDEITSFIKDQEDTMLDELNIKEVIFSDEIKEFGTLTLKPNFKNMKMKFETGLDI